MRAQAMMTECAGLTTLLVLLLKNIHHDSVSLTLEPSCELAIGQTKPV
jgi:hypothetical protein